MSKTERVMTDYVEAKSMSDEENTADSWTSVYLDCISACLLSFTKWLVPDICYHQMDPTTPLFPVTDGSSTVCGFLSDLITSLMPH